MSHVYIVFGVYKELEFVCGVHESRDGADAQATEFETQYGMAGFYYEVREFEVRP
jgi:hypothetical protein